MIHDVELYIPFYPFIGFWILRDLKIPRFVGRHIFPVVVVVVVVVCFFSSYLVITSHRATVR